MAVCSGAGLAVSDARHQIKPRAKPAGPPTLAVRAPRRGPCLSGSLPRPAICRDGG